ncbi:MAG: M20/M25/M40 family metallo-hydrolase [Tannerellaceae bacterium]|jgi:endoglucanase|nr:M20/M25/M40 family metallo-hydrolase [Tannerellaceae bacterium]
MAIFNETADAYLHTVIETPTPSGFEKKGQDIFASYAGRYACSVTSDSIGNIIALKRGKTENCLKLLISAHIDEIGFMVKYIDDGGMVYIAPVGGVDLSLLPGLQLILHHNEKKYVAVTGRKPVHLLNEAERKNIETDSIWVDFGFDSREEALQSISVGNIMTYSSSMANISGNKIVTRSADNKIGGLIMLEVMKSLVAPFPYNIYFVSTVQEEIGHRGAVVAASQIKPDIAIVIDAAHATDYPAATPAKHGDIRLGKGPVLSVSPDTDEQVMTRLRDLAKAGNISCQIDGHPNGTGTEARAIQIVEEGIRTGLISFPVRYMHSPAEIFSVEDVKQIIQLLILFCTANSDC